MLHVSILLSVLLFSLRGCDGEIVYTQPEQVHIALTGTPSEMMINWVTFNATTVSVVEYGTTKMDKFTKGTVEVFVDGGSEKRVIFMHKVKLTGLTPGQTYVYHVGSSLGWSDVYFFRAQQETGPKFSPRFAVYGDMGNKNAQSLGRLQEETQQGHFDAILHIGDFAYNMDDDNARVGDEFMNQIESVAAYVPYMATVGNHEEKYNFSNYKSRFSMTGGDGHSMFYSFNLGPAHFVGFSSEFYYYLEYGLEQIANQYAWLEQDLKEANKPENRAKYPWIITMCHRPLYCSNSDDKGEHCTNPLNAIRVGLPPGKYGIEDLLYKHGVDLHFQAHEHSYERLWPVYNNTVCNGSEAHPYTNPQAPVHIVTGSSGCQEGVDPFELHPQPWSAFHSTDYGYARMIIHNGTHLSMEQIADNKGGVVIDTMLLIKEKHGPGLYDCHKRSNPQHRSSYMDTVLKYKKKSEDPEM